MNLVRCHVCQRHGVDWHSLDGRRTSARPPSGSVVWGTTVGAIFPGEQNTESKEEGARSLAPADRKVLHPKEGLVNTEKFRGRTPPALISTWPEH